MKILIVSAFFPPQNSIASLRAYSWAKYWSQWGKDVMVLTTPKRFSPANAPMPCEGFDVLEVSMPGNRVARAILGNPVVDGFLPNVDTAVRSDTSRRMATLPRRLLISLQERYGINNFMRLPDKHDLWARSALSRLSDGKWDAVVTSGGPYSVHFVGYSLKRRGLADCWHLDWRDLWTDNHIYPGLPILRMLERHIERTFHSRADIITTVSEPLAAILRAKTETKVEVIYNGFDPDDYANLPIEPVYPADRIFRIVYTGTIYAGKRDPTPLFTAIRLLDDRGMVDSAHLQVVMAGRNADVTELARRQGVASYVQYVGFVPRQDALRMQRDADALLFLEFEGAGVEGILTGKLFEYLFAGPPIIAVGIGSESSAGRIIEEANRGYTFGNDVERLSDVLLRLLSSDRHCRESNAHLSNPVIRRFSRSEQAAKLLSLVSRVSVDGRA